MRHWCGVRWLGELLVQMIALDTETNLIGPFQQAPALVCVSLAEHASWQVTPWYHPQAKSLVLDAFGHGAVGHHMAYDACVIMSQWPDTIPAILEAYDADRVTDTGIRAKLLDIRDGKRTWSDDDSAPKGMRRSSYGLDTLAERYLGRKLAKGGIQLRFADLRNEPFERWPTLAVEYSRDDAQATWGIWQAQQARADHLADQYRQTRAELFLRLASSWGLTPDPMAVAELADRVEREQLALSRALVAVGLLRPDGSRNTKAAQARIVWSYGQQGRTVPTTATGAPSLSREVCENSHDPVLEQYAQFARLNSVRTKDIPMLRAPIIHTRFETLVETGRTASKNPNVQNISRHGGVRECFRPRPGMVYVVADFAGLELSCLAQVCFSLFKRSALRDMIVQGQDPHLMMAARILGQPYDALRAAYKAHVPGPEYDTIYNARQTGKVANFGFPGGLGATRLVHFAKQSYGVTLTESQARTLKSQWLSVLPEMELYFHHVDARGGTVEQLFSGRVRAGCSYTEACNSLFQGLGADLAKDAGYRIARAQLTGQMLGRTVNFVHDEFVVETPEQCTDQTAQQVETHMLDAARKWLPDVPCGVEVLAARVYSKEARRMVVDGRLVPWGVT